MKQIALYLFLLLSCSALSATTYYVSPEGASTAVGTSWEASTTLQQALDVAVAGDQVWVKQGSYLPTTTNNRAATFTLPAGVKIFGGFTGFEQTIAERPFDAKSTLSGNIGDASVDSDNVYTVLTLEAGNGEQSQVDGFIITAGTARGFTEGFNAKNAGGGIYIKAENGILPSHLVSNCLFSANKGHNGAAVYVSGGSSSFENCRFIQNHADFKGGAVYNMGATSQLNARFLDCHFEDNAAKYGGAMANNGENGVAIPLLVGCGFLRNVAKSNGAAVYNMTNEAGSCSIITESCFFDGNTSILGDDVATKGGKKSLAQLRQESNNIGVIISGSTAKK